MWASPLDRCTRLAYNMHMIFIETHIFTSRITQSVSDEDYLKNERENITPEQLKTLRKLVEENLK